MAVRSRVLDARSGVTTASVKILEVPAGRTAILKGLSVQNGGSLSSDVGIYHVTTSAGPWPFVLDSAAMPAGSWRRLDFLWVLNPGDWLRIDHTNAALCPLHIIAVGTLLLGAPA